MKLKIILTKLEWEESLVCYACDKIDDIVTKVGNYILYILLCSNILILIINTVHASHFNQ